ncbi:MAG: hypothetical protein HYV54_01590, partial [Parcubacteria group bacterium]|nr:hypothetical protein [Parcubacteria group bacterium]
EGNAQAAYQIIIKDASSGAVVLDTARVNSSSNSYSIPLGTLAFNKTYSWTVTVTDNHKYNPLWSTASGSNFTTIAHAAPAISFTWSPARPAKDEQVTFTDNTTASVGASKTAWQWNFPQGTTLLGGTTGSQATAKFETSGAKVIGLTVTDSDGLLCSRSSGEGGIQQFSTGRSIPQFKEVIPR